MRTLSFLSASALMSCILNGCANSPTYVKPYPIECSKEAFIPAEPPVISESNQIVQTEADDAENRNRWLITTVRLGLAQNCLGAAETVGYIKRR